MPCALSSLSSHADLGKNAFDSKELLFGAYFALPEQKQNDSAQASEAKRSGTRQGTAEAMVRGFD